MANDLLLEIGMEEIPARFIRAAMEQLQEKTEKWLNDSRIAYDSIRAYATPRRIAVLAAGVADKQSDLSEEVRGPSKKAALTEAGGWSPAALGFARSQGVSPDELFIREVGSAEYVFAAKNSAGVDTASLLPDGLTHILSSLTFPKNMRWGSHELRYVRPIRWLVSLFGSDVVPLEVAGVRSGRTTKGHRFLGTDTGIASPAEYVEALRKQSVLADVEERRTLILKQLDGLARKRGWTISIKEDLLEEVLFLVEYPTALSGSINPEFMHIPQEVLITSMREHQRYFPVLDAAGKLLPHFVTVRNGNDVSLDVVARGNEKVLRARLSDARFFYDEDQKLAIADANARLEKIVFHEKLGTIGDKVRRIRALADRLSALVAADEETRRLISRAADICKFDLVTQMVYEFPELQGVMGQDYARKAGEPEPVARAVFEHYQPRFSGDDAPASRIGATVSIADKIDTIVGCFSIGIIPTGSQDPYALRRQAAGIVQILLEHRLELGLSRLFELALAVHAEANLLMRPAADVSKELTEFFALRVKNVLSERGIRYDVVDAVMGSGFDHVPSAVGRADALAAAAGRDGFKTTVESFNRVGNLAAKAPASAVVDASRFESAEEGALHAAFEQASARYAERAEAGDWSGALAALAALKPPITAMFDAVMVMVDDEAVRTNRLALLRSVSGLLGSFADFAKLVG